MEYGSSPASRYIDDPDWVPVEPAWLREKISSQLERRLRSYWGDPYYDERHGEDKTA